MSRMHYNEGNEDNLGHDRDGPASCPVDGCEATMNPAALPAHIAEHGDDDDE